MQAGRRLPELDHALGAHGLRLGHVPQSYEWATVGGCAATRSAGQASTGFGRFDDLVAGLRCATPAGALATLGAPGSAAGPDLDAVLLGSEGTLGVLTEVGLRVRPVAEETRYEAFLLHTFEEGCEALRELAQAGLAPDVARLSDADETRTTVAFSGHDGLVRRARRRGAAGALATATGCVLIAGWEGEAGRRRPPPRARRAAPARGGRPAARPRAGGGLARVALRRARTCATRCSTAACSWRRSRRRRPGPASARSTARCATR